MSELVTISEASKRLGVSVRTVQRRLDDKDNHDYTPVEQHGKRLVRLSGAALRELSSDATDGATRDTTTDAPHDKDADTIEAEVLHSDVSRDATDYSDALNPDATRDTAQSTLAIPESNVLALLADVVTARLREERATETPARPSVPIEARLMLTVNDAAELASVSSATIRAAIKSGRLPALRGVGRGYRIRRGDLEKWIKGLT